MNIISIIQKSSFLGTRLTWTQKQQQKRAVCCIFHVIFFRSYQIAMWCLVLINKLIKIALFELIGQAFKLYRAHTSRHTLMTSTLPTNEQHEKNGNGKHSRKSIFTQKQSAHKYSHGFFLSLLSVDSAIFDKMSFFCIAFDWFRFFSFVF